MNDVDYCLYPARETQLQWLRYYLQAQKGMAVTASEVQRLYVQVNKFALVSACGFVAGREQGRVEQSQEVGQGTHPQLLPLAALWWRRKQSPGPGVRSREPCLEVRPSKSHLGNPRYTY